MSISCLSLVKGFVSHCFVLQHFEMLYHEHSCLVLMALIVRIVEMLFYFLCGDYSDEARDFMLLVECFLHLLNNGDMHYWKSCHFQL